MFCFLPPTEVQNRNTVTQPPQRPKNEVLPGIEPGFRDSESPVITVTLQDLHRGWGVPASPQNNSEEKDNTKFDKNESHL